MRKSFYLVCIVLIINTLAGCKSGADLTKADEAYSNEQYFQALELYRRAYSGTKDKSKKSEIAYKIAESYRLSHDYARAASWYERATSLGYQDPIAIYRRGEILKMQEEYDEALLVFEEYAKEMPSDPAGKQQVEMIKTVLEPDSNDCKHFTAELFKEANSSYNDFSPAIIEKKGFYFTSDREGTAGRKIYGRTGKQFSDIYVMEKEKKGRTERWGTPQPIEGVVNTDFNEGTPTFDDRGTTMYYTQCNGPKGDRKTCIIMMSKKRGTEWVDTLPLPFTGDTSVDYGQPALSPDGTKMIFSSDLPGGYGEHDLYLTTYVKRSRTWSDPVNLGEVINTAADDRFPYFYNDTTIYFSSDGHVGLGGLDIFMSHGQGTEWSKPEHMRADINSGGDDFGIIFNEGGQSGYLTSNRPRSRGDDIYSFKIIPQVYTISGIVSNSKTLKPMNQATVTLTNEMDGTKQIAKTDETGYYMFKLKDKTAYSIRACKKAYFNSDVYNPTTVPLDCSKDLVQNLQVHPQEVTIEIEGILYGLDSFNLRPESIRVLDSIFNIMESYPYIVVELGSHTDCRASYAYNDTLSQKRADTVVRYLIAKGIEADRLVAKGYGERMLKNNCACEPNTVGPGAKCSEAEHQVNRRTTFKVIRWDYESKKPGKDLDVSGGCG